MPENMEIHQKPYSCIVFQENVKGISTLLKEFTPRDPSARSCFEMNIAGFYYITSFQLLESDFTVCRKISVHRPAVM